MRKVNVKLLVGFFAFNLTLGAALVLLHYVQSSRITSALLWQAQNAEENHEPEQAVKYLGQYLEFKPDDTGERAHLCRLMAADVATLSWKALEKAHFNMERVIREDPERNDVRRLLIEVCVRMRRFDLAREQLDHLTAHDARDSDIDRLYARWHDAQGHSGEAARWYRKAIDDGSTSIPDFERLANLTRQAGDPAGRDVAVNRGLKILDEMVAKNEPVAAAYLARARYRLANGADRPPGPDPDVTRALAISPNDADILLAAMAMAQAAHDQHQTRTYLDRGLKANPNDVRIYQAASHFEMRAGNRAAAVAALRRGIDIVQGDSRLLLQFELARLLIDQSDLAGASALLDELHRQHVNQGHLDLLSGRIQVVQGKWSEAVRSLERAMPLLERFPLLLDEVDEYLAACYEQLDQPQRRIDALWRVVNRHPDLVQTRAGLAAALSAAGRYDDALAQYRQIQNLPEAPAGTASDIARLLFLRNQKMESRNWDEVADAIRRTEAADPNSVEVPLLWAELFLAEEKNQSAQALLEKACDRFPKDNRVWAALVNVLDHAGLSDRARRALAQAEIHLGDSAEYRLAAIRYWSGKRGAVADAALARLGGGLDRYSETQRWNIEQALANAEFRMGNAKAARQRWQRVLEQPAHQNDLRLERLVFEVSLQMNDAEGMAKSVAAIRRIEGGAGPFWRYAESARLIWAGKTQHDPARLDEARALLETLAAERPDWPAVLVAKGEIDDAKGNVDQAIANYRGAIARGERNPRVYQRLIGLLCERRRYDEVDVEIRRLELNGALPMNLQRTAAEIALRNRDSGRAVALARQAVSPESKNANDLLWLGSTLAAAGGHDDEAEQCFQNAIGLAAGQPRFWLAQIRHLAQTNQRPRAEQALKKMSASLPSELAPAALAQAYEIMGDRKAADAEYHRLVTTKANNAEAIKAAAAYWLRTQRTSDAEPLLRRLLEPGASAPQADVDWARRNLALLLAARPGRQNFQDALTLAGLRLTADGGVEQTQPAPEIEDFKVRARVLATQPRRRFRTEAIKLFEQITASDQLDDDDRLVLARLQEAQGAWPTARDLLRGFLLTSNQSPAILATCAGMYLRHGDLELAGEFIDRLAQTHQGAVNDAAEVRTLRAQLLEAKGDLSAALAELDGVSPPAAAGRMLPARAEFLARHDRLPEALATLGRAWKEIGFEEASAASLATLLSSHATPEQLAQVEQWMESASRANPASQTLIVHRASLLEMRQQFPQAEALYRQILDKDPKNLVALNNLAWLMSQRSENLGEALELIDRAIELYGPRSDLIDTRGMIHLQAGKTAMAVADLSEAVADAPSPARYLHLARALQAAGNVDSARQNILQAKSAGLDLAHLHPLEREASRKFLDRLTRG